MSQKGYFKNEPNLISLAVPTVIPQYFYVLV